MPAPTITNSESFAASIQATVGSAATTENFARCLQGSADSTCFSGVGLRAQVTGGAAVVIAAPGNLVASATASDVTLSWSAPIGTAVASYTIEAGSSSGLANLAKSSTGNPQTSFFAGGVGAGSYFVRVRAVGMAGETSAPSNEALLVVGGGPCSGAPGPPSGLSTVSVSGSTVVLAWNAAAGNPTSYIVEAGSDPGQVNLANSDLGLTTSLTANGVGAGTYYVRIRAKSACGVGTTSNEIVLTVGSRLWSVSGVGNAVFNMPSSVSRVRITGTFTGSSSNFVVFIDGRVFVHDIIGTSDTFGGRTVSDGVYPTRGGLVEVVISNGVSWTFTQVS
jgi:hypothetical protein